MSVSNQTRVECRPIAITTTTTKVFQFLTVRVQRSTKIIPKRTERERVKYQQQIFIDHHKAIREVSYQNYPLAHRHTCPMMPIRTACLIATTRWRHRRRIYHQKHILLLLLVVFTGFHLHIDDVEWR